MYTLCGHMYLVIIWRSFINFSENQNSEVLASQQTLWITKECTSVCRYQVKVSSLNSTQCLSFFTFKYSRLQSKNRGMLINFWTFFQGLRSLLERLTHILFPRYPLFYGNGEVYFLKATLNIFAKCSMSYVYSSCYVYSRV